MTEPPHRAIGYATAVAKLKNVQRIFGVERVRAILVRHGARSGLMRDLHPRKYPDVICESDAIVLSARVWEAVLIAKEQATNHHHDWSQPFKDAVDLWMTTCDLELRLRFPDLYNDRGDPL